MPLNLDQQLTQVRTDYHNTSLIRSFDIVRQACGRKVGVAAHMHGLRIQDYVEIFGLREVRFGKTATLALGPRLVLGHASTPLSCRPRQDPGCFTDVRRTACFIY